MNKVEVSVRKKLNNLPKVFLDIYLNKFTLDKNYINCVHYVSRSGLTQEGCVTGYTVGSMLKIDTLKEVKGIYYVPHPSIINITFRQKAIRNLDDLKQFLMSLDVSKISPRQPWLLVKYSNYSIEVFDIYFKGLIYEFPLLAEQGHLRIYSVPEPKDVYLLYYDNDGQKREINKELFTEVSEFMIFNHKVTFDKSILMFKNLYVTPGSGTLLYVPEDVHVKLESSDHKEVEVNVNRDTWLLFSHTRPRRSGQD
ncbi:hypothetical protein SIRV1gp41 [Sulfolobus islandicus rod-shaped virus 1]|uniref:Uncharacterized protein 252 n=1 Tax=Sulfolobus islandicus rod-shaped virus 1 TaxID=157898 RepID=Y252_SIRV1|nr:hypothetical protein SIRV1gp41 [Sulfolobus islandicus rod-shaped virus 1]Q8QL15.1 RecName: Full=Uncharacterized protein 252 [Sulfolobus islandicus rod-shaped virus 1]CAC93996.1 hypothetical protein [Sulfolobus islandicus rod-shaped virus 1]CAG38860.1 hypothetical protein [Sulfolobus islandicus rudivirus 1 variant XX]